MPPPFASELDRIQGGFVVSFLCRIVGGDGIENLHDLSTSVALLKHGDHHRTGHNQKRKSRELCGG